MTTAVFRGRGGCGIVQRPEDTVSGASALRNSAQTAPPSTNRSRATVSDTAPDPDSAAPVSTRSSPVGSLARISTRPSPEVWASKVISRTAVQRCQYEAGTRPE
jgi:hypothetical protein